MRLNTIVIVTSLNFMAKVPGSTATAALDDSALVTPTSAPDETEKVAEAWEDEILLHQDHEMLVG